MIYLFYACVVPSCRSIYLSVYLSLLVAMEMCYSILSLCWLWHYGSLCVGSCVEWLVVNRAFEPVERVMCLNVTIASLSHHGRSAKHIPSLGLSLFFLLLFT